MNERSDIADWFQTLVIGAIGVLCLSKGIIVFGILFLVLFAILVWAMIMSKIEEKKDK